MASQAEIARVRGRPWTESLALAIVRIRAYMMVIALAVIWLFFGFVTRGTFLSSRNMALLLRQMSIMGIAATGMLMLLIMSQIDLSVGSTFCLFAGVSGILEAYHHWGTLPALLVALVGGLLVGALHGYIVAAINMPFGSFAVTLGGLLAWRGLENLLSGGIVVSPYNPSHEFIGSGYLPMPISFALLGFLVVGYLVATTIGAVGQRRRGLPVNTRGLITRLMAILLFALFLAYMVSFQGFPIPVLIMGVLAIVFDFITRRTEFGRQLYAIGGNREAARLSGINIHRNTFIAFLLMGLLYAIGGVVFGGRLGVAHPGMGTYLELDAIASCVIGGAALLGGEGTVFGALVGALVMGSLDNGMSVLAVSTFWRYVVKGAVLLGAVFLDITARRLRR